MKPQQNIQILIEVSCNDLFIPSSCPIFIYIILRSSNRIVSYKYPGSSVCFKFLVITDSDQK